jgi:hypothetical protein
MQVLFCWFPHKHFFLEWSYDRICNFTCSLLASRVTIDLGCLPCIHDLHELTYAVGWVGLGACCRFFGIFSVDNHVIVRWGQFLSCICMLLLPVLPSCSARMSSTMLSERWEQNSLPYFRLSALSVFCRCSLSIKEAPLYSIFLRMATPYCQVLFLY